MLLPKRFALAGLAAILATSCGLIDPDIADFDLSLPEKDVVVDTGQWNLTTDENFPAVDCANNAAVCSLGIADLCAAGEGTCFGTCSEAKTCDVKILINLWHGFDLAAEKPELQEIEGKPLVSVSVKEIAYKVTENTMNVDSPELTVYAAPTNVMSPGVPQAEKIGTIAPIPAGELVDSQLVELSPSGRETLAKFMKAYSVPFNIIIGAEVDLSAGDVVPTGRFTAVVMVTAVAGI